MFMTKYDFLRKQVKLEIEKSVLQAHQEISLKYKKALEDVNKIEEVDTTVSSGIYRDKKHIQDKSNLLLKVSLYLSMINIVSLLAFYKSYKDETQDTELSTKYNRVSQMEDALIDLGAKEKENQIRIIYLEEWINFSNPIDAAYDLTAKYDSCFIDNTIVFFNEMYGTNYQSFDDIINDRSYQKDTEEIQLIFNRK